MVNIRLLWVTTAAALLAGSSHAISFGGISTLGTGDGATSLIGTDGINFSLADANSIQGAVRGPIDLFFTVTADPGEVLTGYDESPVGFVRNLGTADLLTTFAGIPGAGPFHTVTTAPAGTKLSLSEVSHSPLGGATYLVDAHIVLTSNHATTGGPSIASLTQMGFRFHEEATPEPASMAALGIGFMGLFARARKRRTN